jgi:hypothetical protein
MKPCLSWGYLDEDLVYDYPGALGKEAMIMRRE